MPRRSVRHCVPSHRRQQTNATIADRYEILGRLGGGSFGEVYKVRDLRNQTKIRAAKLESINIHRPQLAIELKVYEITEHSEGFPMAYFFGITNKYRVLVTDLLGPSLEDLFVFCSRRFSEKTVMMIADQVLSRLFTLHEKLLIHRDLKPDNLVVGINSSHHIIHLIDFGLTKRYRDLETLEHIPFKSSRPFSGTARYASLNVHAGHEQSRRDDLESLGYILVYFLNGNLPWQGLKDEKAEDKYHRLHEMKGDKDVLHMCFRGHSRVFETFINYVRTLGFSERPDYAYLHSIFRRAMASRQFK